LGPAKTCRDPQSPTHCNHYAHRPVTQLQTDLPDLRGHLADPAAHHQPPRDRRL